MRLIAFALALLGGGCAYIAAAKFDHKYLFLSNSGKSIIVNYYKYKPLRPVSKNQIRCMEVGSRCAYSDDFYFSYSSECDFVDFSQMPFKQRIVSVFHGRAHYLIWSPMFPAYMFEYDGQSGLTSIFKSNRTSFTAFVENPNARYETLDDLRYRLTGHRTLLACK